MSTDSGYNQETINGYTILTPKNQTPHIYKNYVPKQAYGMAADYLNRIRQERQQERGFLDDEGLGPKSLGVMNAAVDRDLAANYLGSLPREDVMRYLDPSTSRSVGRNYVDQNEDTERRQGRSGILKKIFQKAKKDGTVDYIKKDAEDEKFYDYDPAESNKRIDNYSGWHKSRPTLYIGDVSTDPAHSDQDFLTGAYRNYLGRDIGNEGRTYWGNQLSGGMSRDDVLSNIRRSSEFKDRFLGDAYQKLLGREIGAEGRDYWGRMIDQGQSNQDILDNIRRSDEYQEAFLQDTYKNLLGRDLGDEGRSYWKEQMRGGMSEDDVLKNIRLSQEYADYFANNDTIDRVGDRDDEKKLIKGIDKQLPLKTARDVAEQKLARTQQRYDDAWRDFSNNPRTEEVVGLNETPSWATSGLEDLLSQVRSVANGGSSSDPADPADPIDQEETKTPGRIWSEKNNAAALAEGYTLEEALQYNPAATPEDWARAFGECRSIEDGIPMDCYFPQDNSSDYYSVGSGGGSAHAKRTQAAARAKAAQGRGYTSAAGGRHGLSGGFRRKRTAPKGQGAGAMRSDIQLKENITYINQSPNGHSIYEWNYKGEPKSTRYQGVMAQELLKTAPHAVVEMDNGYLGVKYDEIDVDFKSVIK